MGFQSSIGNRSQRPLAASDYPLDSSSGWTHPRANGGKGGICFAPKSPKKSALLSRFLLCQNGSRGGVTWGERSPSRVSLPQTSVGHGEPFRQPTGHRCDPKNASGGARTMLRRGGRAPGDPPFTGRIFLRSILTPPLHLVLSNPHGLMIWGQNDGQRGQG